eukprot:TRINITY_DN77831_c0_g1_i1.p1 TRINITY_DN77831_c0_g1~~TRINITY_DN77831_c0_g1_i1.p1  ORF type:complete len:400 (+),score=27.04 TRINITY_DN77831_c0_g1_i1:80-1201(+)
MGSQGIEFEPDSSDSSDPEEEITTTMMRAWRGGAVDRDEVKKHLSEGLLSRGAGQDHHKSLMQIVVLFNWAVLVSWPLFSCFLLLQPLLSNWTNNSWYSYSALDNIYGDNGTLVRSYHPPGLCTTPASELHCSNGQNFTELALKYRGVAVGCGCGQGVFGEGLCPMSYYGFTLSEFVTTGPAIAAMLGLGFFPLLGTWANTLMVHVKTWPSPAAAFAHFITMVVFQVSYILWSIASACVFPTTHSLLTVTFLGAFLAHWIITASLCVAKWGFQSVEAKVTFVVSKLAILSIVLGAIPRVFLALNSVIGSPIFPNWNRGIGSYAFWFAEAAGLSLTFGAYPLVLIGMYFVKSEEEYMEFVTLRLNTDHSVEDTD